MTLSRPSVVKKFFFILSFLILLPAVFLVAAIPALNLALKNEELRNALIRRVASSLSGEVKTESLSISLDNKKINISARDIQGNLLDKRLSLSIPSAGVAIRYSDLLQGSFFPDYVRADSPNLTYIPSDSSNLSVPRGGDWGRDINQRLEAIFGHGTELHVTDGACSVGKIRFTGLVINSSQQGHQTDLNIAADISYRDRVIPVQLSGNTMNPFGFPFSYTVELQADNVPLEFIPGSADFFFSGGTADVSATITGQKKEVLLAGTTKISGLDMTVGWTSDDKSIHQEKPYRIKNAFLTLQGDLQQRLINFTTLDLHSDDFRLSGSFSFDFNDIDDPSMNLSLQSEEMELTTLKMLLPDPLINDWTTQTIFPRLENGTALLEHLVIAGKLSELAKLDQPPYSNGLSWSGTLRNVDTFYNDHKPLAKVESTKLAMDGDTLKIEDMKAVSGKSTLHRGDVTINGLYDPVLHLNADIDGSFSSSWLLKMCRAGLAGPDLQQMSSRAGAVSGQINSAISFSVDLGEDIVLQSLGGKATSEQMRLAGQKTGLPLNIKKAQCTLQYPGTCTVSGNGTWKNTLFSGSIKFIDKNKKKRIRVKIEPDLAELKNFYPENSTLQSLAPCIKTLPVSADITLDKSILTARGSLDFSHLTPMDDSLFCTQVIAANSLTKADFTLKVHNKTLDLKQLTLQTKQGKITGSASFQHSADKNIITEKIALRSDNFPLRSLQIIVPKNNKWMEGNLTGTVQADTFSPADIWQNLVGKFTISHWHSTFEDPSVVVSNMDLDGVLDRGRVKVDGSNIYLKNFTTDSPVTLQADLLQQDTWSGTVRVHATSIDMTSIATLFHNKNSAKSLKLPIERIQFYTGIDHALYNNYVFSPCYILSEVTSDHFFISQAVIKLNENFIWLSGNLDRKLDEISYETYFKLHEIPVDTFFKIYGVENKKISGIMDMEGKFFAALHPGEKVFNNASGSVFFETKNGYLKSSSTMMKILDFISLQNIFDKDDILNWKDSFKYNIIQGKFDLEKGIFKTNSFIMEAPVFDFFSEGDIDIPNENINMKAKIAPFGTIGKILNSIPFFGYIITGKTKSLFDYTVSVQGKINDPQVEYIPLAGTFESLTGYLKRLVTSREEVKKNVNNELEENMASQKQFMETMRKELSLLNPVEK